MAQQLTSQILPVGDSATPLGVIGAQLSSCIDGDERTLDSAQRLMIINALSAVNDAQQLINRQKKRIELLEGLSATDELTCLANRRGFMDQLGRLLASARRNGDIGIVVYCDLDNFKQVNDRYGHSAGDEVLRQTADVLRAAVRDIDVVARLGGDEFAIVMVQTTWRDGARRVRTLQRHLDQATVEVRGVGIPIQASLGIEPYGPTDRAEDLLCRADMAMYCNKRRKQSEFVRAAAAE